MRGVKTNPGQMALHVTPVWAFSKATTLVRPTTPCLAATYATLLIEATRPCTEAILMIRPHFLYFMPGRACFIVWKLELRFKAIILSQLSSGNFSTESICWIPALLTKMSTFPKWAILFSTRDLLSAGFMRSAYMNFAELFLVVSYFSTLAIYYWEANPLRTMLAPAAESDLAIPSPIPLSDPVTIAVLPFKNGVNIS